MSFYKSSENFIEIENFLRYYADKSEKISTRKKVAKQRVGLPLKSKIKAESRNLKSLTLKKEIKTRMIPCTTKLKRNYFKYKLTNI